MTTAELNAKAQAIYNELVRTYTTMQQRALLRSEFGIKSFESDMTMFRRIAMKRARSSI
jgi:hypothetical protein